jgi:hypothetical protein
VREHGAVGAGQSHRHRRAAAAQQVAIEVAEIPGTQRDRDDAGKRIVAVAARDAGVEHDFAVRRRAGHDARHMLDHAAVANADEIVASGNRQRWRRIETAAREQRAVAAENRHRRHLRIAAADRIELVVNLRFARANAHVVETLHEIDDARIERFVHVEHFQRMLFGNAYGAQRDVGRFRLAGAEVVERHHGDEHAGKDDRRDQQRDQRHAPDGEIVLGHGRKHGLFGPASGVAIFFSRFAPIRSHLGHRGKSRKGQG